MEVTSTMDRVTHAVVSTGKVQELTAEDTAEFFHMISDGLYSDKPLACVREVLCNAWDSHIESGIINTPVEVTVTEKKIVIRDFGAGIPHALIGKIYGTYGRSTKKHDGNQTGGFGLGSKAPFAYNEHFEVISFCDGEKTIYSMAKSNAAVNGKPSITALVSVPTDDSGLQVSVNLKTPTDKYLFERLVTQIASIGEMQVKLNGHLIPTIPFSQATDGYVLVKEDMLGQSSDSKIFIRYGNVVYPAESNLEYTKEYSAAKDLLRSLTTRHYWQDVSWVLVLQAEPHSLTVTPSRESLSMADKTIKTITELLTQFNENIKIKGDLYRHCVEATKEAIQTSWLMAAPPQLLKEEDLIPNSKSFLRGEEDIKYLVDIPSISRNLLRNNYPNFPGFKQKDLIMRLDALNESRFGKPGLIKSFKNEFLKKEKSISSDWLHRNVLAPILKKVDEHPNLNPKHLFVYHKKPHEYGKRYRPAGPGFTAFKDFRKNSLESYLPFLRGFVIVSHNRTDILERIGSLPIIQHWMGTALDSIVYIAPYQGNKGRDAAELFSKLGYTVLDLTKPGFWGEEAVSTEKTPSIPRPKKKPGFPVINQLLAPNGELNTYRIYADDAGRMEKPEFVVTIGQRTTPLEAVGEYPHHIAKIILKLFGHRGAVTANVIQEKKALDAGAKLFDQFILQELLKEYKTNNNIETYYRNTINTEEYGSEYYGWADNLNLFYFDPILQKYFGIYGHPNERTKDIIQIFDYIKSRYYKRTTSEYKQIEAMIQTWTPTPEIVSLLKDLRNCKIFDMFNTGAITRVLTSNLHSEKQKQAVRDTLLKILKG